MTSAVELLSVPVASRTREDLITMLRCATKLEHATLPPYLTAWWSIQDRTTDERKHPARQVLRTVVFEEMGHLGTVCNLLRAIGSTPDLAMKDFMPNYPTQLPCDIAPKVIPPNVSKAASWKVGLSRLTPAVVSDVFMIIEYPEGGPVPELSRFDLAGRALAIRPRYHTIGEFYDAIAESLDFLVKQGEVAITENGQLSEAFSDPKGPNIVKPILTLPDALDAIEHIKEQGEGTPQTVDAPFFGHELAHYYRFKQIQVGRLYSQQPDKSWLLNGQFFDFPAVRPMADIPPDGYENASVPQDVRDKIHDFNSDYKSLLSLLQSAWEKGGAAGQAELSTAETVMDGLTDKAKSLMDTPIDSTNPAKGNYGPTFRIS